MPVQAVTNPSFEDMDGANPKGWVSRSWQQPDAVFAVETSGHTGARSVSISAEKGADASWVATVAVRPYSRYRLSGWIKTENVVPATGRGAQINIDGEESWRTPPVTGTKDWTRAEIEFDAGSRALYATDASNYRQVPIGIIRPRDADDVIAAMAVCHERGVPVLARGAGTSLAGQCCNVAVVLDFSKYMRNIVELDPHNQRARVEPGCVLDDFRNDRRWELQAMDSMPAGARATRPVRPLG